MKNKLPRKRKKAMIKAMSETIKCDCCGNKINGKSFPVYNENHVQQAGLRQCGDCFSDESDVKDLPEDWYYDGDGEVNVRNKKSFLD